MKHSFNKRGRPNNCLNYIFVVVLPYKIIKEIDHHLNEIAIKNSSWEKGSKILHDHSYPYLIGQAKEKYENINSNTRYFTLRELLFNEK